MVAVPILFIPVMVVMVVTVGFIFAMMMVVVMVVSAFVNLLLLAVHKDGEVGRGDAAARHALADKLDAWDAKRVQVRDDGGGIGLEFKKCGGEHVACGTH